MLIRNVLSNWVALALGGIISFILTPILIHGLGDLYYGMWILVASLVDYYGLLDIGMRTTMQRYVAHLKGANEREKLEATFATALVLTLCVSAAILLLSAGLTWILPSFFKLQGGSIGIFRWLAALMGLDVAISLPSRLLGAYLCGLQRFDLYNLAGIGASFVRALLFVAALSLGYGVVSIAGIALVVTAASIPFQWMLIVRHDSAPAVRWRQASWARLRELLSFSFYISLSTVGIRLRGYTDAIVIARTLAVSLVTPFSVAGRLVETFRQGMVGVSGPLMPSFSELEGKGRPDEARALFLRATRVSAILSVFVAGMLLLNGKGILRLWVGEKYVSSYSILAALTVGYLVSQAQAPSSVLLIAKGHHRTLGWLNAGEGVANLILSIVWAHRYGVLGVAWGTTVPMLISALCILPWYVLHVTGLSLRQYFRSALQRPVVLGVIFAALGLLISRTFPDPAPLLLLGLITLETAAFVLLAYWIVCAHSERQAIWHKAIALRSAVPQGRVG